MKDYKIVAVLWEDHSSFTQQPLPDDLDELIPPTLTIGILFKKTKKHMVVAYNIERHQDRDEADYMAILRGSILGVQEYGTIPLEGLRTKEGST